MSFQVNAFQPDSRELLARMKRFEDHFVERKTLGDKSDWVKTAVAFANSTPEGTHSIMYIAVTDQGEIQVHQDNLDTLQKKLRKEIEKAYPRIEYMPVAVEENGRIALAVIFPASKNRPHFAGQAFIRVGSESIPASEEKYAEFIARRNSKVSKVLDYKGKLVTVINSTTINGHLMESVWGGFVRVHDCDEMSVTLATWKRSEGQIFVSAAPG